MKRYRILTYDHAIRRYTPQVGFEPSYTLFGLREPFKRLLKMGYGGIKDDPSIRVEEIEQQKELFA